MGLFSNTQKQSSWTQQTSNPWGESKGALTGLLDGVQGWMNDPASKAVYSGPRVAGMSDLTKQGVGIFRGHTGASKAMNYLGKTLDGGYTDYNSPYFQDIRRAAESAVMPSVNASFARAGMVGSNLHQGAMARGMTDAMAPSMFQAYENERQRQMQAAQLLPQVESALGKDMIGAGQITEGYDQRQLDANRDYFNEVRDRPLEVYKGVAPSILDIASRFGTTTTKSKSKNKSTPSTASLIGGGLMMAGSLASGGALGGIGGLLGGGGGLMSGGNWLSG